MLGATTGFAVFPFAIFAIFEIFFLLLSLFSIVMMIFSLIDAIKRPDWQWNLARQNKELWIVLIFLVNFLAVVSLIYWFNIRRKLQAVEAAAAAGQFGPGRWSWNGWEPVPPMWGYGPTQQGWFPDPSGQHRWRWFDGVGWSDHTRDGDPASIST